MNNVIAKMKAGRQSRPNETFQRIDCKLIDEELVLHEKYLTNRAATEKLVEERDNALSSRDLAIEQRAKVEKELQDLKDKNA